MSHADLFRSICIGVCACYVMLAFLCGLRIYNRWRAGATVVRVPVTVAAGQLLAFVVVSVYATVEMVMRIIGDEPLHWYRSPLLFVAFVIGSVTLLRLVHFTYPGTTADSENP